MSRNIGNLFGDYPVLDISSQSPLWGFHGDTRRLADNPIASVAGKGISRRQLSPPRHETGTQTASAAAARPQKGLIRLCDDGYRIVGFAGRVVAALALVASLIGEAKAAIISTHNIASISEPPKLLSELSEVRAPENVFIVHYAPHVERFPVAITNLKERDQNYVVSGATFLAGLCILAYLAVRRNNS